MSSARSEIHDWGDCEGLDSAECHQVDELLDQIEDDRAHHEAEKLRETAAGMVFNLLDPFSPQKEGWVRHIADEIDPYEMRDGQLVRKSDGKPVTL